MELKYKAKNVYKEGTDREQINSFCEGYKSFLNSCRTERLCAEQAQKKLEAAGFTRYNGEKLKAGGKYYVIYRNKVTMAFIAGRQGIEKGINIIVSHVDSPRLDLKPHPLYEDSKTSWSHPL